MLDLKSLTQPTWVDLPGGVRLQLRPISISALRRAQDLSGFPLLDRVDEMPEPSVSDYLRLCDAFGEVFVTDWQGVGDDAGDPLPFSADWLAKLLDQPEYMQAFVGLMMQRLEAWGAKKNASGTARAGNSPTARASATTGAAAAPATRPPAPPARAGKTRRKT